MDRPGGRRLLRHHRIRSGALSTAGPLRVEPQPDPHAKPNFVFPEEWKERGEALFHMELVMITPDGIAAPLLRIVGQDGSELTGPAFDPSGRRLYVSSQCGGGNGITYEIAGPFRRHPR